MGYINEFFKNDIIKGYERKFDTSIELNQIMTTKINNDIYSILLNDNMITVYNADENKTDAFVFNSKEPDVVFTHYLLQAFNTRELFLVATSFKYSNKEDHSIINSMAICLNVLNNDCANKVVFFAENYLKESPIYTIINLKNSIDNAEYAFLDTGDIIIDEKNPYYAINQQEGNLRRRIIRKIVLDKAKTRSK